MRPHALAALVAAAACGPILGIEPLPRETESFTYTASACGECVQERCAAEDQACKDDPSCLELNRCVASCEPEDWQCPLRCEDLTDGTLGALDTCRRQKCANTCVRPAFFDGECDECVQAYCQPTLASFRTSLDFARWLDCGQTVHPPHLFECNDAYPEGFDHVIAFDECVDANDCRCYEEEAIACVGEYAWPPKSGPGDPEVEFAVIGVDDPQYLEGARVTSCARPYCASQCETSFDSATSGPEGVATLRVPGADGCLLVTADNYHPTLFYLGRPYDYPLQVIEHSPNLWSDVSVDGFFAAVGVERVPGLGNIQVTVRDCWADGALNAHVRLESPEGAVTVYQHGGTFLTDEGTSTDGIVYILNVQPGPHVVIADKDGVELGRHAIWVLEGTNTLVEVWPRATKPFNEEHSQ